MLRAQRRGVAAGGLQGVRQGDHGRVRRAHGRPPRGHRPGRGHGGHRALPDGDQGRRPGRGQGGGDRPGRGRGARGAAGAAGRAPLRHRARRGRGAPRGRRALAAGAVRRRAGGGDGAGPGLQAHLRRRPRAEHRRHGVVLARARDRARRGGGDRPHRPPARGRHPARPRHALPRRALCRTDADQRGPQGARVQRALRRPRDPGRAAAPAQRPARRAPARHAARRAGRRDASVGRRLGGHGGAGLGRLPGLLVAEAT